MRFSLFGQGEGVRSDSPEPLWASIQNQRVTDASVSAQKRGVRKGMSASTAQALLPGLALHEDNGELGEPMQRVLHVLWSFTPWLQVEGTDSFYIQVSGKNPPLREVRDVLIQVDETLGPEQRLRVGFAENPFLSRALVEWSRLERVAGAQYLKVRRQQFILSPAFSNSIGHLDSPDAHQAAGFWLRGLPVQALWTLPEQKRRALLELGIERLGQLKEVPTRDLVRHFGKEALVWLRVLEQSPGGRLSVNYPPMESREEWLSEGGDNVPLEQLPALVEQLLEPISVRLEQAGAGALRVGMSWRTDVDEGQYERVAKQPVYRPESLYAQLRPGLGNGSGTWLEQLSVYVGEIRPLDTVQMSFVIHQGALVPAMQLENKDLARVVQQVNRKFPKQLQFGLPANYRELRLRAVGGAL